MIGVQIEGKGWNGIFKAPQGNVLYMGFTAEEAKNFGVTTNYDVVVEALMGTFLDMQNISPYDVQITIDNYKFEYQGQSTTPKKVIDVQTDKICKNVVCCMWQQPESTQTAIRVTSEEEYSYLGEYIKKAGNANAKMQIETALLYKQEYNFYYNYWRANNNSYLQEAINLLSSFYNSNKVGGGTRFNAGVLSALLTQGSSQVPEKYRLELYSLIYGLLMPTRLNITLIDVSKVKETENPYKMFYAFDTTMKELNDIKRRYLGERAMPCNHIYIGGREQIQSYSVYKNRMQRNIQMSLLKDDWEG